ncbi:MAG: hypothetical protein SH847_26850 [Roseiflexaceae bacterium]|nr:hypothetical protein [Roseiflexaceae bacterium]
MINQDTLFVDQRQERATLDLIEAARAGKSQLGLGTIGIDRKDNCGLVEILQKQEIAQPTEKRGTLVIACLVACIGDDNAEINSGMGVYGALRVGATKQRGDHPRIVGTRGHETIQILAMVQG